MLVKEEKTILIADDTPENVDILRELLSDYKLVIAINGKIALKIADIEPKIDLILLDIMMPELNGYQACEILKSNSKTRDIPVIFITALTDTESLVKSFELGAVDYITKPFNPSEVKKRVETHLTLRSYHKKLENMNSILEEKVKQRTVELQNVNSELIVAKNKAEEMNKLKSFFIQNISHEFRTPLISILGFSDIIAQEAENIEHVDFSKKIYLAGQRLQKTLNDIIALTELEKQKIEIAIRRINIITTIKNAVDHFINTANSKRLSLKLNCDFEELCYRTDENLLKYILFNIIDNAIKFTDRGYVLVDVAKVEENSAVNLLIKVADTGIGISQENLETIFSSFRQESEGYSRSYEGMGIGLTIAKQLVEILKGTISIKSKLNVGTEVFLKFPIAHSEEEVTNQIKRVKHTFYKEEVSHSSGRTTILMVEDNNNNRLLLKKMLQQHFDVDEAADGISAVAKSEMKNYDIVLMDINLGPGIDGIEVLRRMRNMPKYENVPVIAVTAYANLEERDKFIEYGFDDFVQKPILKADFIALINKFTGNN